MFKSARLKLTLWYVAIIVLISLLFSLIIYHRINQELEHFRRIQRVRSKLPGSLWRNPFLPDRSPFLTEEEIAAAERRLIFTLVLINLGILIAGGGVAYWLADRTLQPIQLMVAEQDRFISDASHELRTPLTALRTEIEVSLRDKHLSLAQARSLLKSNLDEVFSLQILTDRLMQFTSYQEQNNSQNFSSFSIDEVSKVAVEKMLPLARAKKITIKKAVINQQLQGNKNQIIELLVILLDNAIKYSLPKRKIFLGAKMTGEKLTIYVKDQGVGIPSADLHRIFDRFYRVDSSRTKTTAAGFGLGLSIAKAIVEKHHGTIQAESLVGKGSTFIVSLPLKQPRII